MVLCCLISVTFYLTCAHIILVRFELLSDRLAHSVDHIFLLFVILDISRFGFEGWIWVLIASFPGLCIFLRLQFSLFI